MKALDENGFVFLDDANKPYLVRMLETRPWLYYWHPDKTWVTLRAVTQMEVWRFSAKRLSDKQAALYGIEAGAKAKDASVEV